jgi:hypothetical protein
MTLQKITIGMVIVGMVCAGLWKSPVGAAFPALNEANTGQRVHVGEFAISGPYTHENLTVFLIHGQDRFTERKLLTLQEAIAQKKVTVYETGNVNELVIENLSQDVNIYIQSGDIVKGGKQDRVISIDFIVPPRSGKLPVAAFCVEHGRWSQRQGEAADHFAASQEQVASKDLKLAVKERRQQAAVWQEVAIVQDKLEKNAGQSVRSAQSASSLQLSLENKKVREMTERYIQTLAPITEGHSDVIGYAFAINGQINSADVYASSQLFRKLWPKLLKSSAVEAMAELQPGKTSKPVSADAVKNLLVEAERGNVSDQQTAGHLKLVTRGTARAVLFETRDREQKDGWIHRNYVAK